MKGVLKAFVVLLLCLHHFDAFLQFPCQYPHHARRQYQELVRSQRWRSHQQHIRDRSSGNCLSPSPLTHDDILWKLRSPPETPWWRRLIFRVAANLVRIECAARRQHPPFVLCPKGGQAVLEAYCQTNPNRSRSRRKIARFGISTMRGPPALLINESVEDLYGVDLEGKQVGTAAIIYMFVEPSYRKRGVGELALAVISTIHALQGCDFSVLVADDNGSGKLVKWYERNGFLRAQKLQELFGSPHGMYGVTMMKPTSTVIDPSCHINWW